MQAHTSTQHWQTAIDTLLPLVQAERLGIVVDMDGTLAHITETPEAAVVTPRNREMLGLLVLMIPLVAAISGRAVRDLQQRITIDGMVYIGNHGLERWKNGARVLDDNVRRYRQAIAEALDELRPHLTVGMWIEDKYATASVHYRMTPRPEEAAQTLAPLLTEITDQHGLKLSEGHRLFEIRPPIESNKGTALQSLVDEHDLNAVVYVGDDVTDIDALNAARQLREAEQCYGVGIGVVADHNENRELVQAAADVMADGVADVEELLAWFVQTLSQTRNG